jgi:hypothetical protein
MRSAVSTAAGLTALVGLGAASPGSAFSSMLTKFGLASICGYQTVSLRCTFLDIYNIITFAEIIKTLYNQRITCGTWESPPNQAFSFFLCSLV